MLDLQNINKYRENNRIEAKKALGGLPHSIWETYSAFANTLGGVILLGVEEHRDKTLHTVDLPDPEGLVREFWTLVNDPKKVSVNILSAQDVSIETIDGDRIIVINVPRAERFYRPVYVDGSTNNTYRRSGEGDYRCTQDEYEAMVRDASVVTQDMLVLEDMDTDVLSPESVGSYRRRMGRLRPGHVWESLEDAELLLKLDAVGKGADGRMHPTSAGLLMFGCERDILREYSSYSLEYREYAGADGGLSWQVESGSGGWSGNVCDFYFRVRDRLRRGCGNDVPVKLALDEALANCLVNADYYGRDGLVIVKRRGEITMRNPGGFRIALAAAKAGGMSDPRNGTMQKMFNMIDIGERTGSGIPNIFRVWRDRGWAEPTITQSTNPDRITLSLVFSPASTDKPAIKTGDENSTAMKSAKRQMLIDYLTDHPAARTAEIAEYVDLKPSRVRDLLSELIAEDIVVADGGNRNRTYRLKA